MVSEYLFLYAILGAVIGMTFGSIPGLGGVVALSLLLPVTFGMDASSAMVLFGGTMGGVAFGGSISAILLNTPGTAVNAATVLDGYPLTQQGRATEAIAISATASGLGAVIGLVVLILVLPLVSEVILAFGSVEFFWLAIYGLVTIALVSRGGLLKGLIAGGFGILLSLIGYSNITGEYRFGFGTTYLWDGVQLIPVIIGLFAVAEAINLHRQGGTIMKAGDVPEYTTDRSQILVGIVQVLRRPAVFVRSVLVGYFVGLIPGAGGTVANFLSYAQVRQTSDDPDSFGTGNPSGLIASEAANDAKDGGALIPTVAFGIPGSADMAILLGGFILHGLSVGPGMLNDNLDILFLLILALIVSNVFTSVAGLLAAGTLARITRVEVEKLIAPIVVMSVVGAFALRSHPLDVVLAVGFGIVGYVMIEYGFSRIAIILGLILAPIAERSFYIVRQAYGGYSVFYTRPIALALMVLIVLTLAYPQVHGRLR